jgi:hypothetical protein
MLLSVNDESERVDLESAAESGDPSALFELAKAVSLEAPERAEDLYRRAASCPPPRSMTTKASRYVGISS